MLFLELILQERLGALLRVACCVRSHCNANSQQAAYPRAQLRECTPRVGALDRLQVESYRQKKKKKRNHERGNRSSGSSDGEILAAWKSVVQPAFPKAKYCPKGTSPNSAWQSMSPHSDGDRREKPDLAPYPVPSFLRLLLQKQPNLTSKLLGLYSHYSPESSAWLWQPTSQTHVQVKRTFLTLFYSQYLHLTFLFISSFFIPFLLFTEDKYYR